MILIDNFFIMLAFFYSLREHSFSKQFSKKINKSFVTEEAHNFIMCSGTLFGSSNLIIEIISVQNSKVDNFCSYLDPTI